MAPAGHDQIPQKFLVNIAAQRVLQSKRSCSRLVLDKYNFLAVRNNKRLGWPWLVMVDMGNFGGAALHMPQEWPTSRIRAPIVQSINRSHPATCLLVMNTMSDAVQSLATMQTGVPATNLRVRGFGEDASTVGKAHDHTQQPVHAAQQRVPARQCHQLRGESKHLATWITCLSVGSRLCFAALSVRNTYKRLGGSMKTKAHPRLEQSRPCRRQYGIEEGSQVEERVHVSRAARSQPGTNIQSIVAGATRGLRLQILID